MDNGQNRTIRVTDDTDQTGFYLNPADISEDYLNYNGKTKGMQKA